jgi:hypothetical protein
VANGQLQDYRAVLLSLTVPGKPSPIWKQPKPWASVKAPACAWSRFNAA